MSLPSYHHYKRLKSKNEEDEEEEVEEEEEEEEEEMLFSLPDGFGADVLGRGDGRKTEFGRHISEGDIGV